LVGEFLEVDSVLDRLGQLLSFLRRDASSEVAALLPNLVFEIGAAITSGMAFGGAGLCTQGAEFHRLDLLHLLEDLLSFMSGGIHAG